MRVEERCRWVRAVAAAINYGAAVVPMRVATRTHVCMYVFTCSQEIEGDPPEAAATCEPRGAPRACVAAAGVVRRPPAAPPRSILMADAGSSYSTRTIITIRAGYGFWPA